MGQNCDIIPSFTFGDLESEMNVTLKKIIEMVLLHYKKARALFRIVPAFIFDGEN